MLSIMLSAVEAGNADDAAASPTKNILGKFNGIWAKFELN